MKRFLLGLLNPSIAKVVIEKITQAAMARDVARKARQRAKKRNFELSGLPGKLADCQIQKREGTELFIVEETQLVVLQSKEELKYQAVLPLEEKF